jgi:hypothetical protein
MDIIQEEALQASLIQGAEAVLQEIDGGIVRQLNRAPRSEYTSISILPPIVPALQRAVDIPPNAQSNSR